MAGKTDKNTDQPLDDLMMAMDVVDTLRHRAVVVERELGQEQRDDQLIDRLREIYTGQGIEVPDHILAEGVAALKEERFIYTPPTGGLNLLLARLYVSRAGWSRWLAGLVVVVLLGFAAWYVFVDRPQQASQRAQETLLRDTLPQQLNEISDRIEQTTKDPAALENLRELINEGRKAIKARDLTNARRSVEALKLLESQLNRVYEIRIVAGKGEKSGVWRIPKVNSDARNYYLIVEAIDRNGKIVERTVRSEESGAVEKVSKWGQRVGAAAYDKVRRDKLDDGIVQDNIVGAKRSGMLDPIWLVPVKKGAITSW